MILSINKIVLTKPRSEIYALARRESSLDGLQQLRHLLFLFTGHIPRLEKIGCSHIVGANSEDDNATPSQKPVATVDVIRQGPTNNLIDPYDQEAQRSYADVVRDNRSAHSIELIN